MTSSIDKEITELPYAERQLLIVSHKEILTAVSDEQELQKSDSSQSGIDWGKVAKKVAIAVIKSQYGPLINLVDTGIEAYKSWIKARNQGAPIKAITFEQSSALTFPPGHPREGIVYVGHPAINTHYYTMSDFHRFIFEHKISEVIRLLMSLGATSINVEHVSGWSTDIAANLSIPLTSTGDSTASVEAGSRSNLNKSVIYSATLSGSDRPKMLDKTVWLAFEPTWSSIADGRLHYGLNDFDMKISYLDDFGINAGLKAVIMKSGLDIGGKFEDHQATTWRIAGKFKPKSERVSRSKSIPK